MLAPAGVPHLPALLSATAVLALLAPAARAADEPRDERIRAIQSTLPKYDPAIREKYLETKNVAVSNKSAPIPTESKPADARTPLITSPDAIELPKMTVHPDYIAPKPLPRLTAPKPLRDLKGEPFESGSARDARLIKKHLSVAAQAVNRLLGNSLIRLAREAEAQEKKTNDMNALADAIDLDAALGRDPEQAKKIRDAYEKLYYSGPK